MSVFEDNGEMKQGIPRKWFAIEFASLDFNNDEELNNFLESWEPKYSLNVAFPGDWYNIRMFEFIHNQLDNDEKMNLDCKSVIMKYRSKLIPFQLEIRSFIDSFIQTAEISRQQTGIVKFINMVAPEKTERLNEILKKIRFSIQPQLLEGYKIVQVIAPDFKDFECCLYYNFIEYLNTHHSVLKCAHCGQYISNPSRYQLANSQKGYPTVHQSCQREYKLSKDRSRKSKGSGRNE
ncbi:hypothetical protein [Ectobacillus sp. sgz5001026]|uniref:hypothetical protein n=1 Tax=Ectobacillus sp. sgz5001026 TaxID=3242473 RepID=UPI0036D3C7F5